VLPATRSPVGVAVALDNELTRWRYWRHPCGGSAARGRSSLPVETSPASRRAVPVSLRPPSGTLVLPLGPQLLVNRASRPASDVPARLTAHGSGGDVGTDVPARAAGGSILTERTAAVGFVLSSISPQHFQKVPDTPNASRLPKHWSGPVFADFRTYPKAPNCPRRTASSLGLIAGRRLRGAARQCAWWWRAEWRCPGSIGLARSTDGRPAPVRRA
jgi:hypothetical protein